MEAGPEPALVDTTIEEMPIEEPPAPALPYSYRPHYNYHAVQMTWLVAGILEFLLGVRLVFKLLGANGATSFVQLVNFLSWPLERLFDGIFPNSYAGDLEFESGSAAALVIVLALTLIVVAALKILTVPPGTRMQD
jgi:hypothetical protein